MAQLWLSAERTMRAPASVVYRCIANYREHHRPGGFLPPAFTELIVEQGGVGEGTVIRFQTRVLGRSRWMRHRVSEPEPGRVLVEAGPGEATRFTVEPQPAGGCLVRIESRFELSGLQGLLMRLLLPRVLPPLYADELQRLEHRASVIAAAQAAPAQ